MSKEIILSDDEIQQLKQYRDEGKTFKEITKLMGYKEWPLRKYAQWMYQHIPNVREENAKNVLALYDSGMNYKDIAATLKRSYSYVRNVCKDHGREPRLTPLQSQCKELFDQGYLNCEIAWKLGKPANTIRTALKHMGCQYTLEQVQKSWEIATQLGHDKSKEMRDPESHYKKIVEAQGFTYLGNYTNCEGKITVKCNVCGYVFEKCCNNLRAGHSQTITCPHCANHTSELLRLEKCENALLEKIRKHDERKQKELQKELNALSKWRTCICKQCGKEFAANKNLSYCSEECRHKAMSRQHDHRINYKNNIDKDITLEKLYNRDSGTCYICGKHCDWNDISIREDGAYITGKDYPTIEHVIPLCKGGTNSWDNVKLACWECNTKKGRKSCLGMDKSGQVVFAL